MNDLEVLGSRRVWARASRVGTVGYGALGSQG